MIPTEKLDFVLRSLGISQTEAARAASVSPSMVCHITSGNAKPSLEVAIKLDAFIKAIHLERNGETIPPEVREIVMEILYPKNPFDPSEKSKRNSRSKTEVPPARAAWP
ncbi:MAG TPA: helix-turn-helix transcriptional regulator [Planctomycetota bacterium]|jgi:DNA-binding XRE family transcriptional regulator